MNNTVIPLPEHLKTCGCPRAEFGTHLSSCLPAREYEATPLSERDGYIVDGDGSSNRFQGIIWDYPLKVSVHMDIEVELDPVAWFTPHLHAYLDFELDAGYDLWEKPMVFLAAALEDSYTGGLAGWHQWVAHDNTYMDDLREHPRWNPEDTVRLHRALGLLPTRWSTGRVAGHDWGVA